MPSKQPASITKSVAAKSKPKPDSFEESRFNVQVKRADAWATIYAARNVETNYETMSAILKACQKYCSAHENHQSRWNEDGTAKEKHATTAD